MRSAVVWFVLAALAGMAGVLAWAVADQRDLAFTLGVVPGQVAASLGPGVEACQEPIDVSEGFTRVRLQVGSQAGGGQPLAVAVRSLPGGRTLASGRLQGGYRGIVQPSVRVGRVAKEQRISVCIRNAGTRPVALWGGPHQAAAGSRVVLRKRPIDTDLTLVFLRERRRSALALVPVMFEHASRFHPSWVGPWTFWLLAALVVGAVPLLLGIAVVASREP